MPFATSADGTRVYYELEGEGPAVVLQHGTGGSGQSWRDRGLVEAMRDRFQLVLVDSRGHGRSDRPTDQAAYALPKRVADLTAIMDHAGIDRAHFYGFSMGGWIGYGVLMYAPGRFHSAVIGGFGPIVDPYFGNDPAELARGAVERRERVPSDEYEVLHAVFRETAAFEGAEDAVRDASMPLLFFAGTEEPRYESVKAAATLNERASFFELPGLNHGEAGQAAGEYVPRLIEFFDRVVIDAPATA